ALAARSLPYMADLEAITRIETPVTTASGVSTLTEPGIYSWRHTLPENKGVWLGSGDAQYCDWSVPEDKMISRRHALLNWDGAVLTVTERPITPEYPKEPTNRILFQSQAVRRCEVRPGQSFLIGKTAFTLKPDDAPVPDASVDATAVQHSEERSRDELKRLPFTDPHLLLGALEQLPAYLRGVTSEAALFKQMLKVAVAAMPKADAAAIVRVPPDCPVGDLRVTVVEQNVRELRADGPAQFVPSRKLVRRVVCDQQKSCLHVWSAEPSEFTFMGTDHGPTLSGAHQQGGTPWAICTPFRDGSQHVLYVSGRLQPIAPLDPRPDSAHLTEYQKFIEILVGLIEATRRTLLLAHQVAVAREAWPRNLRGHLEEPEKLEALLRVPQEKEVTVLFCDLRGYSARAEENGANLSGAWAEVQKALDVMSSAVTDAGGIVAGFRGDAVLGFWGWPEGQPDQIERATRAALRIYEKLSGPMIDRRCGLGLTHGRALAGRLGAHDLAVVDLYGPVVNLAFRLEEMTKAYGVGIVIADELAAKLRTAPAPAEWRLRALGTVRPRGMKAPLRAFELSPARPVAGSNSWVLGHTFAGNLPFWNEAVEKFTSGAWDEAKRLFDDLFGFDPAARCFVRFMARTSSVPPKGWDGSFTPRPEE
ncbi:MAG TPA: adenylate/guanylate cyclase domain-containing protein, partial [Gemmata sp.]